MKRPLSHAALMLLSALALASCNTAQTPPDPLKDFTGQQLAWQTCDPTIVGEDYVDYSKQFGQLGDRLQCADMKVPLDWSSPARGAASMSLIRVKAEDAAQRQGSIFFNPGGPGGDGLIFAPYFGIAWTGAKVDTPIGANFKKISQQYDLIGFSPRGVGASTRLYCGSNELTGPINPPASDRSEPNIARLIREGQLYAKACQKNTLTPYINTDATARDLDLARQLLGDAKLNYIGYSYGTWLGSWYAKLFPKTTGRMLLDGNTSFESTFEKVFGLQPRAFERDYREVALAYVARLDALFGLGQTKEEVYARHAALHEPVKAILSRSVTSLLYGHDNMPVIGILLKVAVVVDDTVQANPDMTTNELVAEVGGLTYLPDPDLNAAAQSLAQQLVLVREANLNAQPSPVEADSSTATFLAVTCNDTAWNRDLSYWRARDDEDARNFPLVGGGAIGNPCLYWQGGPSVQKPAVPADMPALLMLQNEYDPATPVEGALDALNSTPNAKMILIDNESQHAAFPYDTECVDLPITRYFLDGSLPGDRISPCQARPLPGENQVYPVGQVYVGAAGQLCLSPQGLRSQSVNPTPEAQEAVRDIRKIIERNGLRPVGRTLDLGALTLPRCK